jgi:hypothetical protein
MMMRGKSGVFQVHCIATTTNDGLAGQRVVTQYGLPLKRFNLLVIGSAALCALPHTCLSTFATFAADSASRPVDMTHHVHISPRDNMFLKQGRR